MDEVAKLVLERMRLLELSILDLSEDTGVNRHTIGRWLSGRRTIKLRDLLPILRELDIEISLKAGARERPSRVRRRA